ncbi:SDR family oxidoreductase [bacterium]|nr:SDR family oxidoreductase [bacterium]
MTSISFSLNNKVAIVTGASRGVGKAIALAFADAGADVVVASRTVPDLEETAAEIRSKGRKALIVKTDISQKPDIENLVKQTVKTFGTIDILVNNAAQLVVSLPSKLRDDGWDKMMNINLKGCFLLARETSQVMIEHQKGSIINIGSVAGMMAVPYESAYAISKAGLIHLSKILAGELAHYNVRVNSIEVGLVKTRMSALVWKNPENRKVWENNIPMHRIAEPSEIAAVAVFLASEAASYVTGASICVDGGAVLAGFNPDIMGATLPEDLRIHK